MKRFRKTSVARIGLRVAGAYLVLTLLATGIVQLFEASHISDESRTILTESLSSLESAYERGGRKLVKEMILGKQSQPKGRESCYFLLLDQQGNRLTGSLEMWPRGLGVSAEPQLFWAERAFLAPTQADDPTYWPAVSTLFPDGSRLLIVRHQELGEEIREIALPSLWLTLLSFGLGALFMVITLGGASLRRVDGFNLSLQRFREGDLGQRVPLENHNDEFDTLGRHLNSVLERVEALVSGLRRVTIDVAHDLRSPLTRLCSRLEVTLLKEREREEYEQVLADTLRDLNLMTEVFNSLLYIGQLESDRVPLREEEVDLSNLCRDMADLYSGEEAEVVSDMESSVKVRGDRELLQRMLSNLLDNALKYSPPGSEVKVGLRAVGGSVELSVSDRGPGISEELREMVLERFYRVESARSTPGSGLGLSLVKAAVEAHGGELRLSDNNPGLRVTVILKPAMRG